MSDYDQPPFGQPNPYGPPQGGGTDTVSVISLVLGGVSILGACCCSFVGIGLGITAAVLGFIGLSRTKPGMGQAGRGLAIAGIATGIAGCSLSLIFMLIGVGANLLQMFGQGGDFSNFQWPE